MEHRVVYEKQYDSEVEYLESTGTQYINTLKFPHNVGRWELDIQYTQYIIDQINGVYATNDERFDIGMSNSNNWFIGLGIYVTPSGSDLHRHKFILDNINNQCCIDDNQYVVPHVNFTTQNSYSILIANRKYFNKPLLNYFCKEKIYSSKMWDINNNLIQDLTPVRVGLVGYMYDKVSGKLFGNKGTGNFILGQDVSNPVPNIRRVFRFDNKRFVMPIPSVHYDSKIEYLQSTGTQWIDTDCIPNKNTGFYFDGVILSSTLNRPYNSLVFGVGTTYWRKAYVCYAKLQNDRGLHQPKDFVVGNRMSYDAKLSYDTRLQFSLIDEKLIATDRTTISVDFNSFTPLNYSMLIFGINFEGSPNYFSNLKIYNFKIYDNNTLIRDFIPVRRGNTGYLYDKVSKKLFKNKGTGQFILGNDIN